MIFGQSSESSSVTRSQAVQITVILVCIAAFTIPASAIGVSSMSSLTSFSSQTGSGSAISSGVSSGSFTSTDSSYSGSSYADSSSGTASGEPWIIISSLPLVTKSGKITVLTGHLGGSSSDAEKTVTVYGREKGSDTVTELDTVTTDSQGMFIWPVPGDSEYDALSVRTTGSNPVSASIRVNIKPGETEPVIMVTKKPTSTPTPDNRSVPTMITLSASTRNPQVGTDVTFSGKLIDSNRKGVKGTVTAMATNENGFGSGELTSTSTDDQGNFDFTVKTWQAGTVPVYVKYDGDENHLPSESNTLMFSAY